MENLNLGLVELNGRVLVSSRDIARVFEKEHRDVLKSIRNLSVSDDFRLRNFAQSNYWNEQNHEMPEYLVTRDGFTILAMGYTGDKAMRFKEAYIRAFNEMENQIKQSSTSIESLIKSPDLLLALVTKHIGTLQENQRLQLTEAKYKGQCDTVSLYRIGEIAAQLGINAMKLNSFLHDCRVQYRPNGSPTWRLYTEYLEDNIALPRVVSLPNGHQIPMLLWTAKGRDFIFDLAEQEQPTWYCGL